MNKTKPLDKTDREWWAIHGEILARLKARIKNDPARRIYELGLEAGYLMLARRTDPDGRKALERNVEEARQLGVIIDLPKH